MDRSLDDIVSERHSRVPRGPRRGGGGGRRNERTEYPRDGVRKPVRDEPRNLDSEWVHDKFDTNDREHRGPTQRRERSSPERNFPEVDSAKLKVENIHYDLTEDDLDDLFNRIGPVEKLALTYDRAGRSNGVAYVTYARTQDAKRAIREFDGANANGQPIRLTAVGGGRGGRNPFDNAVRPSRPLQDRITRARSFSPVRHTDVSGPAPDGVDRYVPGRRNRSRSPLPRRRGEGGRRPGARRERGERSGGGGGGRPAPRPKKTQEELDAEMEDYWGGGNKEGGGAAAVVEAPAAAEGDIEMAE